MTMNRRHFLRYSSAAGLSAATMGTLGAAFSGFQTATAADTTGYKALVCVFLFGGMDCHDTVLPYDQASYDRYAEIRAPLLGQYEAMVGGSTRARDRLLPLNPLNAGDFGGRQFALPEEFSSLHTLFEQGDAAIVGNVGPLVEPLTREEFWASSKRLPKRLFSHNDQMSTWMANEPEGAQYGWGGSFADAAIASNANTNTDFTAMTTRGNDVFLTGQLTNPYQLSSDGAPQYDLLERLQWMRDSTEGEEAYQALRSHFSAISTNRSNLIEQDVATKMQNALEVNEAYKAAVENVPSLPIAFPEDELGIQLQAVANTIQARSALGANRQIFFVGLGSFDTHSNQANDLPVLQRSIDQGISTFYQTMISLGLGSDVTIFTASDFGRTLAINGDGTDHGWGAHHFVVGSGVTGQTIYGSIPPYDLDHEWDVGSGRLLPTVSVSQYAEPLGRWFGLTDAELATALPNLGNFTAQKRMKFLPVFR